MNTSLRPRGFPLLAGVVTVALTAIACTFGRAAPSPTGSSSGGGHAVLRLRVAGAPFHLPSALQREVAVLANDTIYVAGGVNAAEHSSSSVFTVNPATGDVAPAGSVPQPFHDAGGAVIGGRLFVFGGGLNEGTDAVQAIDLESGKSRVVGRLPKPLSDLSAVSVGSTVYLLGGYDGTLPQSAIYATTDGLHFRTAGRLPRGLRYMAVATAGNAVVVAGGISSSGPVSDVYLFDPGTGRVSLLGHLPSALGHGSAFAIGGVVYVAGGQDSKGRAVRQVVAVDPAARTISRLAPLPTALSDAAAVSDGSTAWLIGGWRGTALSQVLTVRVDQRSA